MNINENFHYKFGLQNEYILHNELNEHKLQDEYNNENLQNLNIISAHGSTSPELIDMPLNTYLFFFSNIKEVTYLSKMHDFTINFKIWFFEYNKYKQITSTNIDIRLKKFFYRNCIKYYLFNEYRKKLLFILNNTNINIYNFIFQKYMHNKKYYYVIKIKKNKKIISIKHVKHIKKLINDLINTSKFKINKINYFIFILYHIIINSDNKKYIENNIFKKIIKFWTNRGFEQFVSPLKTDGSTQQICNMGLNFLTSSNKIMRVNNKENIGFWFSGIINFNDINLNYYKKNYIKYLNPPNKKTNLHQMHSKLLNNKIIEKKNIFKQNDKYKLFHDQIKTRHLEDYFKLQLPHYIRFTFNMSPYFTELLNNKIEEYENIVNNQEEKINQIPSWKHLFKYKLNDFINTSKNNGIYIIEACRNCLKINEKKIDELCFKKSSSLKTIPTNENDHMYKLLTYLDFKNDFVSK